MLIIISTQVVITNLTLDFYKANALENLSKDNNILVTKKEKGKGVVILNWQNYLEKIENIFSDEIKLTGLNVDWMKKMHSKTRRYNEYVFEN